MKPTDSVNGSNSSLAQSSASPSSEPATTNFVFVNQADDLASFLHGRIKNEKQRQSIRSHVMHRVRRQEQASGKKHRRGSSKTSHESRTKSSGSHPPDQAGEATFPSTNTVEGEPRGIDAGSYATAIEREWVVAIRSPSKGVPLNIAPANGEFDPFATMPSNKLPHRAVEGLLRYCFDVLLPMTFSVEVKHTRDRLARQGMVLQSQITSPATFLGFMATIAAHRAIYHGRHRDLAPSDANHDDLITDPDYKVVKHEAIVAVRKIVETRQSLNPNLVDACFGLISTATVVGNFDEARMHLKGIAQVLSLVGNPQESTLWVPISNVKVSVGLLSRPLLQLPWPREPVPPEVLQRISPAPGTAMARMGSDFRTLGLSQEILALLATSRDICNLCELNALDPRGLSSLENAIVRQKATEAEFDFLEYVYQTPAFDPPAPNNDPVVPALEQVMRLAALGFLSFAPHTILPASGLGRALTQHQKRAMKAWLQTQETADDGQPPPCGIPELKAIIWAAFVGTQCALRQPEEAFFTALIPRYTRDLGLSTWLEVEHAVAGFLYIPTLQAPVWKGVWAKILPIPPQEDNKNKNKPAIEHPEMTLRKSLQQT